MTASATRSGTPDHTPKGPVRLRLDKGALAVDPWAGYRIDSRRKGRGPQSPESRGLHARRVKAILAHVAATAHADTADHWLPYAVCLFRRAPGRTRATARGRCSDRGNIPALRITDEGEDQKVKNAHSCVLSLCRRFALSAAFWTSLRAAVRRAGLCSSWKSTPINATKRPLREMTPDPRGRLTEVYGGRFSRKVLAPLGIRPRAKASTPFATHGRTLPAARRLTRNPATDRGAAGRGRRHRSRIWRRGHLGGQAASADFRSRRTSKNRKPAPVRDLVKASRQGAFAFQCPGSAHRNNRSA